MPGEARGDAVVVLGAGPAGLGAALGVSLSGGKRPVRVIEKKAGPGGLAGSFSWNGHTVDFGPHRLSPNLKNIRVLAKELLGPDCLVNKSQHGVQFHGRLYQFPPRIADWAHPASLWEIAAFAASFAVSKLRWITRRFEREDFESTVVSSFGRRFYDTIVAPMAEKVWIEPRLIDPAFVEQRFALVHPMAVLKKALFPQQDLNPSIFYYPRKGFQQLWDNMADYLERRGQKVLYEALPTKLEVLRDRVVAVEFEAGGRAERIEGEGLDVVSTIPIVKLLEMIQGFDAGPLLEKARRAKFRSMFLVALEFDRPRALPYRTLIFPEKEFWFNRLFEQNAYSRDTVAPGKSLVVADVTYPRGGEEGKLSDEEIVRRVREGLRRLPYIDADRVTAARVERVEFAYVVPDLETRRAFHEIHHGLKKIHNLHLTGRFAAGEYDNSDYAVDHGLALGAALAGRISQLDYLFVQHEKRDRNIVG